MTRLTVVPYVIRRGLCAAHLVLIAVLSLLPAWLFPPSATQVPGMDKVVHVLLYGVLGALLRWTLAREGEGKPGPGWPAAAIGYGLLMEVAQLTLSGGSRSFSWADAVANAIGVIAAWVWTGRILAGGKMQES